jgi:hypothetical protein
MRHEEHGEPLAASATAMASDCQTTLTSDNQRSSVPSQYHAGRSLPRGWWDSGRSLVLVKGQ